MRSQATSVLELALEVKGKCVISNSVLSSIKCWVGKLSQWNLLIPCLKVTLEGPARIALKETGHNASMSNVSQPMDGNEAS